MIPQPVEAVLLLFPVSDAYERNRQEEDKDKEIAQEGNKDGELIWWKQTIGNACGERSNSGDQCYDSITDSLRSCAW